MIDHTELFESFVSSSATMFAIFQSESEHGDNNFNVQLENKKAKMVRVMVYVWLVTVCGLMLSEELEWSK